MWADHNERRTKTETFLNFARTSTKSLLNNNAMSLSSLVLAKTKAVDTEFDALFLVVRVEYGVGYFCEFSSSKFAHCLATAVVEPIAARSMGQNMIATSFRTESSSHRSSIRQSSQTIYRNIVRILLVLPDLVSFPSVMVVGPTDRRSVKTHYRKTTITSGAFGRQNHPSSHSVTQRNNFDNFDICLWAQNPLQTLIFCTA